MDTVKSGEILLGVLYIPCRLDESAYDESLNEGVLTLGCGHGLPGIFTGFEGAAVIHFQDFNAEWNVKDQNCNAVPDPSVGYDIILMAETICSVSALPHLCELIKKFLNHPNGSSTWQQRSITLESESDQDDFYLW
ncbi:putative methyltransferase family protein [Actinidia rufa]|uniref:Putative methyltransferase family protein n=1 Tax=Actinidia rufa TaxID=165716 RepID=A0A7J0F2U5_9ERIC|nr:putative methyltransferase family protein [Actinidia rufa]